MLNYLTARFLLKSTCEVTRLPPFLTVNGGNIRVSVGLCDLQQ